MAEKVLQQYEIFGHQRTLIQLAIGSVAHLDLMRAVEPLGTQVAPLVRAEVAARRPVGDRPTPRPADFRGTRG